MESLNIFNIEVFKTYENEKKLKFFYLAVFLFLLFLGFVFSINIGDFNFLFYKFLTNKYDETEKYVFYNIRFLRSFSAIIIGCGLGLSGAVLQAVLRNPMASPYTLGISQGAAFGASFVIIFLGGGFLSSLGEGVILKGYSVIIGAFIGSITAILIIFFISLLKSFSRNTIILAGISVGAIFSSLTMFMQYFADDIKAAATFFWTFGDISKSKWIMVYMLTPVLVISVFYFVLKGWHLNLFGFGADFLKNSGVNYKKIIIFSFIFVSLTVSLITSFVGIIGFVGLLAPHIARFFSKGDKRFFIIYSFILGGLILLISDVLSRKLFYPSVIPVGIITSFFGIIVLLYIIFKGYDRD
ncbi:MAG TPA: iron ABC transporter permease [Elusimicrobiales bacterium]|nr:iron ABC transporter permease [Elusimicrobiales bacterium]